MGTHKLVTFSPAVTEIPGAGARAADTMHTVDESEIQVDDCALVLPVRTMDEKLLCPNPAPVTVTLTDPVDATLVRTNMANTTLSYVTACDMVPVMIPAVIAVITVPRIPVVCMLVIELSDTHMVASAAELPVLDLALEANKPMLAPAMVTLVEPVAAWFALRVLLKDGVPKVTAKLKLPTEIPVVIPILSVPASPPLTLRVTLLSEIQSVDSAAVPPYRAGDVKDASPMLALTIVTPVEPVAGELARTKELMDDTSTEKLSVVLPVRIPAVIVRDNVFRIPSITIAETLLSDSQDVACAADGARRAALEWLAVEKLVPTKVRLTDPVAGAFVLTTELKVPLAKE
eukprot:3180330-Rhodomonas_salina.1